MCYDAGVQTKFNRFCVMIALFLSCILFESSKITFPELEETSCIDNLDCEDIDGDGFIGADDCDDSNPLINPDAEEICDLVDNNCNGLADDQEGILLSNMSLGYLDADGDGFAGETEGYFCIVPENYFAVTNDCDDSNPNIYPFATEVCDEKDNDCDNLIDEDDPDIDLTSGEWFYSDVDMDGFGTEEDGIQACVQPENMVTQFGDCEPNNPEVYPTAEDIPNDRIDQNCDEEDSLSCFFQSCDMTVPLDDTNEAGIDFVNIPAGSDPLGRYLLSQDVMVMTTEWTQEMMEIIEGLRGNLLNIQNVSNFNSPKRPVERIRWHEAAYVANVLTNYENTNLGTDYEECYTCTQTIQLSITCTISSSHTDIYSCDGYRLPTSAEWEYFARAGATEDFSVLSSTEGENMVIGTSCNNSILSEGTDLQDYSWYCVNNEPVGTKNVAQKLANSWGVHDVYGNVYEWMHDDSSMIDLEGTNPTSLSDNNNARLLRGGAYNSSMINMHNGFMTSISANAYDEMTGFRLVRSSIVEFQNEREEQ